MCIIYMCVNNPDGATPGLFQGMFVYLIYICIHANTGVIETYLSQNTCVIIH
jgi:hypothetical protein